MQKIAKARYITVHRGLIIVLRHFVHPAFVLEALLNFKHDKSTTYAQYWLHLSTTKGTI